MVEVVKEKDCGKDEMNLAEFPITLISNRHHGNEKTLEYSDVIKINGKDIKREWSVTGSDKFGLPLAQDNDVLLALLYIGKLNNFKSRKIHFSRFDICKIMKIKPDGRQYKRIEAALDRLMGIRIKAVNVFWDNELKEAVTIAFGIIDDYKLYRERRKKKENEALSFANLNEPFYKSIVSGYIKSLDLNTYFSLNSWVSKRLYRYLDKKRYGKKSFEIDIFLLTDAHIGLTKSVYVSQIKEKLDPAHYELIKAGFLESATYEKTADGNSLKVIYKFADKLKKLNDLNTPIQRNSYQKSPEITQAPVNNETLKALIKVGITEKVARGLLRDFPEKHIKEQLKALPYRKAKDPAALLVLSIKDKWEAPADYKSDVESKKRVAEAKARKEEEKRREAERRQKIKNYLKRLSRDEMDELESEARARFKNECGKFVCKFGVPDNILESYVFVLAGEKLEV